MGIDIWIWLGIVICFVVAEAVTIQLVSLWFILGSVVSFCAALFGAPVWLQIVLFLAVSILALLIVRPIVKKRIEPKPTPTNADMVIGKTAVVKQAINNDKAEGRVVVEGQDWAARSYDGSIIEKGKTTVIQAIKGVKLIVVSTKEEP